MAAPTTTVRSAPPGKRLEDGYSSKIAFNRDPDANFWESLGGGVGSPGIDGGDEIDISTMHNTVWRTFVARTLKTLTEFSVTALLDPIFYTECVNNLINQEGSITRHFPDGSKVDFYGFLKSIEFDDFVEGEPPTVTLNIVPTNYDPVNRVEAGPVVTEVAGT